MPLPVTRLFPLRFVSSWFKARCGRVAGLPSPSGDTAASPRSCRLRLVLRCLILRQAPTSLTTMIAADFCRITTGIPSRRAMSLSRSLPLRSPAAGNPPQRLGLDIPVRPLWIYGSASHRYVRQISPGKNAMFRCTSAAFTVGAVPMGFAVMCQLASAPSAFYAVSVRRLARLHSSFLQTSPHRLALAFG